MTTVTVKLPRSFEIEGVVSQCLRAAITDALESQTVPRALPEGADLATYSLRIPPSMDGMIMSRHPTQSRAAMGSLLAKLIWSRQQDKDKEKQASQTHPSSMQSLFDGRPEQERYWSSINNAISDCESRPIVLAEGGTGLGKGRVIAAIAMENADRNVVVCSPTVQVMAQNLREYQAVFGDREQPNIVLGRAQYVSSVALEQWINDAEDQDATARAQAWIDAGAGKTCEQTRDFHAAQHGASWLMEDLLAICPAAPEHELRLNVGATEKDKGNTAYVAMRKRATDTAKIVYCTHAAVVWDAMLKKRSNDGLLPSYNVVVIDEAHQFIEAVNSVFTRQIAVRTLISQLRDPSFAQNLNQKTRKTLIDGFHRLTVELRDLMKGSNLATATTKPLDMSREVLEHMRPWLEKFLAKLSNVDKKLEGSNAASTKEAISFIRDIIAGTTDANISISPVRHYPSIASGPRGHAFFMNPFWENVDTAVLVSATLYLPRDLADPSYNYIKTVLCLPAERIRTFYPTAPAWLYSPTLMIPHEVNYQSLCPPNEKNAESEETYEKDLDNWHNTLATVITKIYAEARGGVLVLFPGYDQIEALGERLSFLGDNLVVQTRGKFRSARAHFIACATQGNRPLWLATGPAWTGLDLNAAHLLEHAPSAAEDFLCTDLVIPRVPFGTDHSPAHVRRRSYFPTSERDRATYHLRQGIGRLVRRDGLQDRRIWMLDTRIWNRANQWLYGPIRACFKLYGNRKFMDRTWISADT